MLVSASISLRHILWTEPPSWWLSETGRFSAAIYTPTIIAFVVQTQRCPPPLTSAPREAGKCVSWLTTGWCVWLQLQHLAPPPPPNRGDSLLRSIWKLTAKHSQLDVRYFEPLTFSSRVNAGPERTWSLRRGRKLKQSFKTVHLPMVTVKAQWQILELSVNYVCNWSHSD